MKINNINSIYRNNMNQAENLNKGSKKDNMQKDVISISEMAKKIHQISNSDDLSENSKIEELKNTVNNKTYKADINKLAEKIYQALKVGKNE